MKISEIKPLTGIRIAAAAWVILYHLYLFENLFELCPWLKFAAPVIIHGDLAVPFFFILSGFILSHVYFQSWSINNHWQFIWARVARLWPVHCVLITLSVALLYCDIILPGKLAPVADMHSLLGEVLMVRYWSRDGWAFWNQPSWSIHIEWFAYLLLFPIAFSVFSKIRSRMVLIAGSVALLLVQKYIFRDIFPGMTGRIVGVFLAGAALSRLRILWPEARGDLLTYVGAILFLPACICNKASILFISFSLLILGLSYESGLIARFFGSRVMVYCGSISFALYMVHSYVEGFTQFIGVGPVILLSFAFAAAMHHCVEVPANRWLRSLTNKKPASAALPFPLSPLLEVATPAGTGAREIGDPPSLGFVATQNEKVLPERTNH